jgi:nitroreductase
VDAYLAAASKRDEREYAERPVPEDAVRRILDAGRIAGSAKNRQPWRFLVLGDRGLVDEVAQTVHAPPNLLGTPLVSAIVVSGKGPVAFDAGRAAQSMMLAAWNEGVVSCPNGIANPESLAELLGVRNVLSSLSGARETRKPAHPRSGSAEAVREAASVLEFAWAPGPGNRDRGRGGLRRQLHQGLDRPDGRRGPHVRAALRAQARRRPAQPRDARAPSQIEAPTTWARATGCAATRGG